MFGAAVQFRRPNLQSVSYEKGMSLILCIETGTDVCSVALSADGRPVSVREEAGRDHARKVAVFTEELFRESGTGPKDLDAVAVGRGPGSYTGLRIGTSFAKGLCYALDVPLLAVDSLAAMAAIAQDDYRAGVFRAADWTTALLCPMIDARRMEVYAEVFDTSLERRSQVAAEVVTPESFGGFIRPDGEFFVFGNGAAKTVGVLPNAGVRLIDIRPSARGLCRLAQAQLDAGRTEDIAYFEPAYLKDFVVTAGKKKLF